MVGGARRDRTDDLKLAKLALSQLSYGPEGARTAASGDLEKQTLLAHHKGCGGPGKI
jgi:hypothetical protein